MSIAKLDLRVKCKDSSILEDFVYRRTRLFIRPIRASSG